MLVTNKVVVIVIVVVAESRDQNIYDLNSSALPTECEMPSFSLLKNYQEG